MTQSRFASTISRLLYGATPKELAPAQSEADFYKALFSLDADKVFLETTFKGIQKETLVGRLKVGLSFTISAYPHSGRPIETSQRPLRQRIGISKGHYLARTYHITPTRHAMSSFQIRARKEPLWMGGHGGVRGWGEHQRRVLHGAYLRTSMDIVQSDILQGLVDLFADSLIDGSRPCMFLSSRSFCSTNVFVAAVRHQTLQLGLVFMCGISQISPGAYFLRRDVFHALATACNLTSTHHCTL